MDEVVEFLEEVSINLFKWFGDNLVKSNAGKCLALVSSNNTVNRRTENVDIRNSLCEELFLRN